MTHKANSIIKAAMISALIVLGGVSSIASAGGDRGGRGNHLHSDAGGYYQPSYAGKISIDGYSTSIRSGRSVSNQIARAFRNAGYRAWVTNGRVRIDYGWSRPRVRWHAQGFNARFNWDCGELEVSVYRQNHRNNRRQGHRRGRQVPRRSFGLSYCD